MDSEITGRKVKVTKELRTVADAGLARIEKIVGKGASAHVIFSSQKHAEIAEVTVTSHHHTLVGLAEAPELTIALHSALEKVEKQAIRRKTSMLVKKRKGKPISAILPVMTPGEENSASDTRRTKKSNGTNGKVSGMHVIPAQGSMAKRPMTIEEAVKEAESRDEQVFVFRDLAGDVKVLHCAGDGIVRLIEVQ